MNVASLTLCYPSDATPHAGVFIRERLRALDTASQEMRVRVVHPLPTPLWMSRRTPVTAVQSDPPCWRVPMPYLPLVGKPFNPWAYARAVLPLLSSWTRRRDVDVIDAHFCWPDGVAAAMLARQLRLPYTITLRGILCRYAPPSLTGGLAYPWSRRSVVHALRGAAAVIAVSQSLKHQAVRLGIPDNKIHVVPNGVDGAIYTPGDRDAARAVLGRPDDEIIMITVGHLCRRKGFHRVLKLLPDLIRQGEDKPWAPNLRYVIVGADGAEGRFESGLIRLARKLNVSDRVTFTGALRPPQIATWLQAADIFVLPTTNEGWCNALAEALATGLPVVCSDVGGNREQVRTDTGLLVSPRDSRALRDAIVATMNRTPAGGSRQSSQPTRTWTQVAEETAAVLRSAVAGHQPRRARRSSENRGGRTPLLTP